MINEFLNKIFPFLHGMNDLINNHYLYLSLIRKAWGMGQILPTFNPYIYGGRTLIGDSFNATYYPPNWLFGFLPMEWAVIINLIFHLVLMFGGMFLLLRFLKFDKRVSICASLIFILWPKWYYSIVAGHLGLIQCFAWTPLMVLLVLKSTKGDFKATLKNALLFFAILTLNFWSSNFFFLHIIMFLFMIYFLIFIFANKNSNWVEVVKFLGISLLLFFATNAFHFIPMMKIASQVNRSELLKTDILPIWSFKNLFSYTLFPYKNLLSIDQEQMLFSGIIFSIESVYGIIKAKFAYKKPLMISMIIFILITINFKTPFFAFFQLLPGTAFIRVTSRFWIFVFFILVIFFAFGLSKIKNKLLKILIVFLICAEYFAIDFLKLTSKNIYGDQKYSPVYRYLQKNYSGKKIYTTEAFLTQYFVAIYNLELVAGSSAWQDKEYMKILRKAGGYSDFNEHAIVYPPYQRVGAQPAAKYLCELKGEIVLSKYKLIDPQFKYKTTVDKIKIYENTCFKH